MQQTGMDWDDYRERIVSEEYRYNVPALFADPDAFASFLEGFCEPFDPADVDQIAGIDALGFIPGSVLAHELDAGFVSVR